ncbi:MAG: replication-associated recombination protein A [Acidobacteria bacterium]|nr:replication-associated recombination protein A [Acidobacteriota bacterium]
MGRGSRPLAERLRPERLDQVVGQKHLLAPGRAIRTMVEKDRLKSMILWGPPGVGKTTIARLLAAESKADFIPFSAVLSGIKEIKTVMAEAEKNLRYGRRTVVFVDEIHRFNKAQQDAFLPSVERGDIVLIGATTENPSFEVNGALLSRAKVFTLRGLSVEELSELVTRGLKELEVTADEGVVGMIAAFVNGDARNALNLVEMAASLAEDKHLTVEHLEGVLERKMLLYDKSGEEHYNLISALHKSVRSSDVDAALYWLARMLESGEDRMYLARRLVRMAVEDIGLADPRAVEQAIACQQTVHFLGEPEGDQALAQITIYLAVAPKSDAAYRALKGAVAAAKERLAEPVPMQLRNAPTRLMKQLGYGDGYQHAHQSADAVVSMECMPAGLEGTVFYEPTNRGVEAKIRERLEEWKKRRG